MKKHLILFVLILFGMVSAYSQGFGYHYSTGRENVQMQTPIAAAGADYPEDIWAVSGNMQPFGTCANDADTPPLRLFACRETPCSTYYGRKGSGTQPDPCAYRRYGLGMLGVAWRVLDWSYRSQQTQSKTSKHAMR